jgi:glucose-1-phosphate cytidylyltransferase
VTAVNPPGRFGEIRVEDSLVTDFNEKPLVTQGLISGGFFVFHRQFVKNLPEDPDLILERQPLHDLTRDGQLSAYVHDGYWHCMDSSRDYNLLNNLWSSGQAPWMNWRPSLLRIAA